MNYKMLILFFILILWIIGISGCLEPQKTFSDESITFNYPAIFKNEKCISNENWTNVLNASYYTTEGVGPYLISVNKSNVYKDPEIAFNDGINSVTTNSSGLVYNSSGFNLNDVKIYKFIYSADVDNKVYTGICGYFKDKKGTVYVYSIIGPQSPAKALSTSDMIHNSLKLN